ncbi:MAG: sugar ABC transporter ATP-binding protein [Sphaerochaetaceae bacterium]|nr:sugar ABC transporter ATP-binding protein [Sphaerochaetaceae bacterium]
MNTGEVLRIEGLKKQYPGVQALKDVDISFSGGEVHGLVGENGAGKSTLIKILAGIVKADEGVFRFDGKESTISSSKDATRHGLSFIHQELNLVNYFNAMENIFLGHTYPRHYGPLVDWKKLREQTRTICDSLSIDLPLEKPVSHLSAVQRAMVAIARAFAVNGRIYFMDEPATALTDVEKEKLFNVIQSLKEQGKTVVYVTHNLDDILRITDRITVMRDGQVVKHSRTSTMTKDSLISAMIGKNLASAFPPKTGTIGKPLMSVENLSNSLLRDISFTLHSGEILGIGGLVGSGRTELLETLFGVRSVTTGTILLDGTPYRPGSPGEAISSGVVLVPEERRKGGLVLSRSINENITLMSLPEVSRFGFLRHTHLRRKALEAGRSVRLKASDYEHHVDTLSGGNQQKVVFAKTVMRIPKVLMLDEPSKGVDVGARFEIYSIIRDLASHGAAIIVVSSDFNEVLGLADRILFIREGGMTSIHDNEGIDQEQYLHYCYGRTHA